MKDNISIAIAGNPNSGKTTIYNGITSARQHIGNYPGVTVEKKEGYIKYDNRQVKIIDLPGTYSLTAHSIDEVVARNVIIKDKPDVVVDVLDSSNLERNLYLAVQLMELRRPLLFVFNMKDMADKMGISIDIDKLSKSLGVPIVEAVGSKKIGLDEVLSNAVKIADSEKVDYQVIKYDDVIEKNISSIENIITQHEKDNVGDYNTRWLAIKLLENDENVLEMFHSQILAEDIKRAKAEIHDTLGETPDILIATSRYKFVSKIYEESVKHPKEEKARVTDTVDSILLNRVLGVPIFLGLMYLVFQLTFTLGDPFMGWIEEFFEFLSGKVDGLVSHDGINSLIVDGIIGGVGGVIVFLPNIVFLFLGIAILEASGYMARAAFLMDKLMSKIGLHGKSFIPFLVGFGCSIPAIMATRTLDNPRDRLITMLVTPFMSCGARLPIYMLIIPAFFEKNQALVLWSIYLIGIILAIVCAKILGVTILKGEKSPFVMELPPYRVPTIKGVLMQMWERSWLYLKKAGTILLAVSIILWALTSYPKLPEDKASVFEDKIAELEESVETQMAQLEELGVTITEDEEEGLVFEFDEALSEEELENLKNSFESKVAELKALGINITEHDGGLSFEIDANAEVSENAEEIAENMLAELGEDFAKLKSIEATESLIATLEETIENKETAENELAERELEYTVSGRVGKAIEPILHPIGFDWKIGTAFIGAFAAKEVFVAQLGIVYSLGEADEESESLREVLARTYSPLTGFCIMVFALLSAPCMATFAIVKRESNTWRWAFFQLVAMTIVAYIVTFIIFNIGKFLI